MLLEIEATSDAGVRDYLPYRVPAVWLFRNQERLIYQLQDTAYVPRATSRYFRALNLRGIMARCMQIAYERNTSTAVRALKPSLPSAP